MLRAQVRGSGSHERKMATVVAASVAESEKERRRFLLPKKTASGGGGLALRPSIGQSPAPRGVSSSVGWVAISPSVAATDGKERGR
ncbi:hypothetical protein MTO96_015436 [Rhipicephalus appendiculatus]